MNVATPSFTLLSAHQATDKVSLRILFILRGTREIAVRDCHLLGRQNIFSCRHLEIFSVRLLSMFYVL